MARTIVGVLRGGTSNEYPLSLKTGAAMLAALPEDRYEAKDILIDKSGMWHLRGMPMDPARTLQQVDVVLNGLHGGVGEDGTVQRVLDRARIPYVGSRALPSSLALNKIRSREILSRAGIHMPRAVSFSHENNLSTADMARAVFSVFGPPYLIKPVSEGAGNGIRYAATVIDLSDTIGDVLGSHGAAVIEEYIVGEEASVAVIQEFRGDALYALPPAQVVLPTGAKHLDFDAHDNATVRYVCPSNFSHSDKVSLIDVARAAHKALGLSHVSRSDIILTRRGPYLLEVNALPGLYNGASFPAMLEAVGSSVQDYLQHSIALAR